MNRPITSKEALLTTARALTAQDGLLKLTVRKLAGAAGVSIGTVYNYFPSKEALIEAVIRSVWLQVFHGQNQQQPQAFLPALAWVYSRMQAAQARYPDLMAAHDHRTIMATSPGLQAMHAHIQAALVRTLEADPHWPATAAKTGLSPDQVVHFALTHLKYAASDHRADCRDLLAILAALLEKEDPHASSLY
ncbi:TetR/AcrR family transcriptional regulator [Peptococcus simiae]|uniref:TetR/AcrR family transcriptional regulator n=1 Tax=Peptococcus simiae TaxID=1643805 RepID=A0ABW9H0N6_9FIRM